MPNTITSNGSVTANIETLRVTNDVSFTQNITGSNVVALVQNIPSGSWTGLITSSLSDVRWLIASNEDLTSSIALSLDGTTAKQFAYLQPGDSIMLPNSGSLSLYAKGFGTSSNANVLLQYLITEN